MLSVVSSNTQRGIDARLKMVQQEAATQLNVKLLGQFKAELSAIRSQHVIEMAQVRAEAAEVLKLCRAWYTQQEDVRHTIQCVLPRICRALGVSEADIMSDRQTRDISFARHAVYYWACRLTGLSAAGVGRHLGRDHTSVLHGRKVYVDKRAAMGRTLRRLR